MQRKYPGSYEGPPIIEPKQPERPEAEDDDVDSLLADLLSDEKTADTDEAVVGEGPRLIDPRVDKKKRIQHSLGRITIGEQPDLASRPPLAPKPDLFRGNPPPSPPKPAPGARFEEERLRRKEAFNQRLLDIAQTYNIDPKHLRYPLDPEDPALITYIRLGEIPGTPKLDEVDSTLIQARRHVREESNKIDTGEAPSPEYLRSLEEDLRLAQTAFDDEIEKVKEHLTAAYRELQKARNKSWATGDGPILPPSRFHTRIHRPKETLYPNRLEMPDDLDVPSQPPEVREAETETPPQAPEEEKVTLYHLQNDLALDANEFTKREQELRRELDKVIELLSKRLSGLDDRISIKVPEYASTAQRILETMRIPVVHDDPKFARGLHYRISESYDSMAEITKLARDIEGLREIEFDFEHYHEVDYFSDAHKLIIRPDASPMLVTRIVHAYRDIEAAKVAYRRIEPRLDIQLLVEETIDETSPPETDPNEEMKMEIDDIMELTRGILAKYPLINEEIQHIIIVNADLNPQTPTLVGDTLCLPHRGPNSKKAKFRAHVTDFLGKSVQNFRPTPEPQNRLRALRKGEPMTPPSSLPAHTLRHDLENLFKAANKKNKGLDRIMRRVDT